MEKAPKSDIADVGPQNPELKLSNSDSKIQKWRTALRILRAVMSDAASGRKNWPAVRKAMPELKERMPKDELAIQENWPIPPREEWHHDPFSAGRFPQLRVLSFHNPKTAGTAFVRCLQASSIGDGVHFISGVNFVNLHRAVRTLPVEDQSMAFANAIAAGIPADAKVIQGHVLFNSQLAKHLPWDRPEVFKVTWLRRPEDQVYSRVAFFRKVLLRNAPEVWKYPKIVDAIFREVFDGCMQPVFRNKQASLFKEISIDKFDFVGITEFFEDDLAQIGSLLSLTLKPLCANASEKSRPLTPDEVAAIREYHAEDVAIYERALAIRLNRLASL